MSNEIYIFIVLAFWCLAMTGMCIYLLICDTNREKTIKKLNLEYLFLQNEYSDHCIQTKKLKNAIEEYHQSDALDGEHTPQVAAAVKFLKNANEEHPEYNYTASYSVMGIQKLIHVAQKIESENTMLRQRIAIFNK